MRINDAQPDDNDPNVKADDSDSRQNTTRLRIIRISPGCWRRSAKLARKRTNFKAARRVARAARTRWAGFHAAQPATLDRPLQPHCGGRSTFRQAASRASASGKRDFGCGEHRRQPASTHRVEFECIERPSHPNRTQERRRGDSVSEHIRSSVVAYRKEHAFAVPGIIRSRRHCLKH